MGAQPGDWVPPDACTLPTAERPLRLAEFRELFADLRGVTRRAPHWLRLRLAGTAGVERRARELVAREGRCCAFFAFAVHRDGGEVVLDVRVPADRAAVLDGLAARAVLDEPAATERCGDRADGATGADQVSDP